MRVGHKWCFPTDVHTPHVKLARLGYCCCHWKTSFSTYEHATSNAFPKWLMSPSWCEQTTFDVCISWQISPNSSRCHCLYMYMLRQIQVGHDRCVLVLVDAHMPWLMSPSWCPHTIFDLCMPWHDERKTRLLSPHICAHATIVTC